MIQDIGRQRRLFWGGSLLFGSVYLHYGVVSPFLPVWYGHKGFSEDQIGYLLALPMFLKLVAIAPVMTWADRSRRIRDFTFLTVLGGVALMAAMNFIGTFYAMLALTVLFALFWDTMPVLADAYGVSASRDQGLDFGRMRLWGSIAFVVSNLASGAVIQSLGASYIVWIACICLSLPLLVIPFLPADKTFEGARPAASGEWKCLLGDGSLMMMIMAVSLVVASHALLNGFSSVHWLKMGATETQVGALWAIAVGTEVITLFIGKQLAARYSPALLVVAGGTAAAARWIIMSFDPPIAALFYIQPLQGISGIAPILAMMLYIEKRVPPHLIASAQGLYAPTWSACLALATVASGPLWRVFGTQAYFAMALIAGCGLALAMVVGRRPMRIATYA